MCEIKFRNYRWCKFGPHCLLEQDASLRQYFGTAPVYPSLILQHFAYSLGHCLLILLYWGGNGNMYIKSKTTAKFKGKQTSVAAARDQFLSFAGLPDPLSFSLPTTFKLFHFFIVPSMPKYIYDRCSHTYVKLLRIREMSLNGIAHNCIVKNDNIKKRKRHLTSNGSARGLLW